MDKGEAMGGRFQIVDRVADAILLLQSIDAKVDRLNSYLVSVTDGCPECRGAGWYPGTWPPMKCSLCAGSGRVPKGRGGEG